MHTRKHQGVGAVFFAASIVGGIQVMGCKIETSIGVIYPQDPALGAADSAGIETNSLAEPIDSGSPPVQQPGTGGWPITQEPSGSGGSNTGGVTRVVDTGGLGISVGAGGALGGAGGNGGIRSAATDASVVEQKQDAASEWWGFSQEAGGGDRQTLARVAGNLGGCGTQNGIGSSARFCFPHGIVSDGLGNLFVSDMYGGTIRKVVIATGEVTTLVGLATILGHADGKGASARFTLPAGLAFDGAGNLFVADSENRCVRKVVVATGEVTTLAGSPGVEGMDDGIGLAARFWDPMGLALDGAGNLYVADVRNQTIRKIVIATREVSTFAGTPDSRGREDGVGPDARFDSPTDIAYDGAGNLFVSDTQNYLIRKIDLATREVRTVAGSGLTGAQDGFGADVRFWGPGGLDHDGAGNLFVPDYHAVRRVNLATGEVTTLVGTSDQQGSDDGVGPAARFDFPRDLVSDGAGNLFVVDDQTVRKVEVATRTVTTLAGKAGRYGSEDGSSDSTPFSSPRGLAADSAGNVYVTDAGNSTVLKIVPSTGAVSIFAGSTRVPGSDDGVGSEARFSSPRGIASDGAGNIFVADPSCNTIRKIVLDTATVTTLAGKPYTGGSVDGVGADARFRDPTALAADGAGKLFVADRGNHTIRQIVIATGAVTTLAGTAGEAGASDGIGAAARFGEGFDLVGDGLGNLYISDGENHTVRKVVIATGAVTTIAGRSGESGSTDGVGPVARFFRPSGIAYDGAGSLFIADSGNHTVRKLVIATGAVTTVVGSPDQSGVVFGALPAGLYEPSALTFGPTGNLFILDEYAVLVARF